MRTTEAPTLALLTAPVRKYAHRVELEDADGEWIDVTPLWLGFTWGEDRDAGAATGTLRLRREVWSHDDLAAEDFETPSPSAAVAAWGGTYVNPGTFGKDRGYSLLGGMEACPGGFTTRSCPDVWAGAFVFTGLPPGRTVRIRADYSRMLVIGYAAPAVELATLRVESPTTDAVLGEARRPLLASAGSTDWQTLYVSVPVDSDGRLRVRLGLTGIVATTPTQVRQMAWDTIRITGIRASLAPLIENSTYNTVAGEYSPLANPFHRMRVSSAVYAPADEPSRDDAEAWESWYATLTFTEVFRGVIDDPSWGGRASVVELAVRDLAAPLQDALILDARPYGSVAGTPIEDVQQQIFVDNGFVERGTGELTIEVLGDTEGWSLQRYAQALGVSVWDAVRALALQMGWDFRYWWHADDTYRPTLLKPRRDTSTVDLALTTAQFTDVPRVRLNGTDIRNDGRLTYRDVTTGQLATVYARDEGSIAAFGGPGAIPRSFGITEDATSQIDTEAEAQQMLDAAVADLATPYVEQDVVLPYLWPVQLGDVLQFPETTVFADDVLRFGVVSVHHELAPESAKCLTTVGLRGRPIGAYQRWLDLLGLRATTDTTPRPVIGPLLGEASAEMGATNDGACWLPITFEAKTDAVEVFTEIGSASPLPIPLLDDNHRAYLVRRSEGTVPIAAGARTVLFFATWPTTWRKTYARPIGGGALAIQGAPVTHEAQAVDGFSATLGAITSFSVTRSEDGKGNTLTWVAAACSSPYAVELLVWRNGSVIDRIPWTSADSYTDDGLPPDREYHYDLQAWTNDGVAFARSGPRATTVHAAPTPTAGRVPTVFANLVTTGAGFPGIGVSVVPGAGVTDVLVVEQAVDSAGLTGTFGVLREYPYDGTTAPAFIDVAVVAGRTYRYRAYARTAGLSDSAASPEASVTIPTTTGVPALDLTVSEEGDPPAFTLLVTPPVGADTISVYKARSSLSFTLLVSGVAVDAMSTETAIVDDVLIGGKTYRYYVTTTDGGVESAVSNTVTAIAPMPP